MTKTRWLIQLTARQKQKKLPVKVGASLSSQQRGAGPNSAHDVPNNPSLQRQVLPRGGFILRRVLGQPSPPARNNPRTPNPTFNRTRPGPRVTIMSRIGTKRNSCTMENESCKMRLFDAVQSGSLEVPKDISKIENSLRKEWRKKHKDARAAMKASGGGEEVQQEQSVKNGSKRKREDDSGSSGKQSSQSKKSKESKEIKPPKEPKAAREAREAKSNGSAEEKPPRTKQTAPSSRGRGGASARVKGLTNPMPLHICILQRKTPT